MKLSLYQTEQDIDMKCWQCGKMFASWDRIEKMGGEINTWKEFEFCCNECYQEYRLDNRDELCN